MQDNDYDRDCWRRSVEDGVVGYNYEVKKNRWGEYEGVFMYPNGFKKFTVAHFTPGTVSYYGFEKKSKCEEFCRKITTEPMMNVLRVRIK